MQLTSARLQSGFRAVLHGLIAHALLNTPSWRVEVDSHSEWDAAEGVTTVELWLQPPRAPTQRTTAELRSALDARFAQSLTLSLTAAEEARVTKTHLRAASLINATFGATSCPEVSPPSPSPLPSPPPSPPQSSPPADPPPMLPPLSSPLPVTPPSPATVSLNVQLFDSFGDGWGGLQLVVRPLSGAAIERSFSLPSGSSRAEASFSLLLGCYQLQMYHQDGEPLTGTITSDTAEASWRLLDCPSGVTSLARVYLAREAARVCVTAENGAEEASCAFVESPMLPPPPSPHSPPSVPAPVALAVTASAQFWSSVTLEAFNATHRSSFEDALLRMVPCSTPCAFALSVRASIKPPSAPPPLAPPSEPLSPEEGGSGAASPQRRELAQRRRLAHGLLIDASFTLADGACTGGYAGVSFALATLGALSLVELSARLALSISRVDLSAESGTGVLCGPPPAQPPRRPPPLVPSAPLSVRPSPPASPSTLAPSPVLESPPLLHSPSAQPSPSVPLAPGLQTPPSLSLQPAHPPPSPSPIPPAPSPKLPPPTPTGPSSAPVEQSTPAGRDGVSMIGDVDSETFMVRLMFGVIGSASVLFFCHSCYDVSRISRRAHAQVRRKAERDARITDVFVCDDFQDSTQEHTGHNAQFWRHVDEQLQVERDASTKQRAAHALPGGPSPQSRMLDGASRQSHLLSRASGSDGNRRCSQRMARWMPSMGGVSALSSMRSSTMGSSTRSSAGTSAEPAKEPPVPLIRWGHGMTLSGPPGSSVATEPADNEPTKQRRAQCDTNRFASPPLVVLATGGARVATVKPLRRCFMLHSVVLAATADALEAVLLEAAELRKLKHPGVASSHTHHE